MPTVTYDRLVKKFYNSSGGVLASGDVVIFDSVNLSKDGVKHPTSKGQTLLAGVVAEASYVDQPVYVCVIGTSQILVDNSNGAITVGDPLITKGSSGIAVRLQEGDTRSVVGIALESYDSASAGLIKANIVSIYGDAASTVMDFNGTNATYFTIGKTSVTSEADMSLYFGNQDVPAKMSWEAAPSRFSVAGNLDVSGNLSVRGGTTTIFSETLTVNDNVIVLNNNVTGMPSENAGIEVGRGTDANASMLWDETYDQWRFGLKGSELYFIGVSESSPESGYLPIGNGTGYTLGQILGTSNQVSVVVESGSIHLSLPQNVHSAADVEFNSLSANSIVSTDALSITSGSGFIGFNTTPSGTYASEFAGSVAVNGPLHVAPEDWALDALTVVGATSQDAQDCGWAINIQGGVGSASVSGTGTNGGGGYFVGGNGGISTNSTSGAGGSWYLYGGAGGDASSGQAGSGGNVYISGGAGGSGTSALDGAVYLAAASGKVMVGSGSPASTAKMTVRGGLDLDSASVTSTLVLSSSSDGAELLQFNTESPWSFYQMGSGANTSLELRASSEKVFYITNKDKEAVARFSCSNSQEASNYVSFCEHRFQIQDGGDAIITPTYFKTAAVNSTFDNFIGFSNSTGWKPIVGTGVTLTLTNLYGSKVGGLYTTVTGLGSANVTNAYGLYVAAPLTGVNRYSAYFEQPSGGSVNFALCVDGGAVIANNVACMQVKGNGAVSVISNGGLIVGSGNPGGYGAIRSGSLQLGGSGIWAYSFGSCWYRGTGSNPDDGSVGIVGYAHSIGAIAPVHKIFNASTGVNNVATRMQLQAMGTGNTVLELCKPSASSGTAITATNSLAITRHSTGVTFDVVDATADQTLTFKNSDATYDLSVSFDVKSLGFYGAVPVAKQTVTLSGTAETDIAAIKTALVNLGLIS